MNKAEVGTIVGDINDLVEQIVLEQIVNRARRSHERIKQEIRNNSLRPFEQDRIYAEHFGSQPSEAQFHEINGVEFTTRILHQTGTHLSDVSGADLLYEIEGVKFLVVQYKSPDEKHRIFNDSLQLKNLINSCPTNCNGNYPKRLIGFCGSWYNVIDNSGSQYLQACHAKEVFGSYKSRKKYFFDLGISRNTFVELFASCRIGAPITYPSAIQSYMAFSLAINRMIFYVEQNGQF